MKNETSDEAVIYEDIKEVLTREVTRMKALRGLDYDELKRLETLTKIYAALKDDVRADLKAGLL